jgi:hypothetical protein
MQVLYANYKQLSFGKETGFLFVAVFTFLDEVPLSSSQVNGNKTWYRVVVWLSQ